MLGLGLGKRFGLVLGIERRFDGGEGWFYGALYTVVLSDEALEALVGEGNDYIHWVVTNIPGNNIEQGNEMSGKQPDGPLPSQADALMSELSL